MLKYFSFLFLKKATDVTDIHIDPDLDLSIEQNGAASCVWSEISRTTPGLFKYCKFVLSSPFVIKQNVSLKRSTREPQL